MEFTFDMVYNQKALTAMAKSVRKTARAEHSKRSHIFGVVIAVIAAFLAVYDFVKAEVDLGTYITIAAIAILIIALIFEDSINAYFAGKRAMKGTQNVKVIFKDEEYESITSVGTTQWSYDNVQHLAKTGDYVAFVFSTNHAQVYDLTTLQGGSAEQFAAFVEEKTGKKLQQI